MFIIILPLNFGIQRYNLGGSPNYPTTRRYLCDNNMQRADKSFPLARPHNTVVHGLVAAPHTNQGKSIERSSSISSLANDESQVMDEQIHTLLKSTDPLTASLQTTIGKIFYDYDYKRSKMLSPRDSIATAIAHFKAAKIECILVGDSKQLYGILSERDIIQNVVLTSIDRDRQPISSIMRPVYEIMEESN